MRKRCLFIVFLTVLYSNAFGQHEPACECVDVKNAFAPNNSSSSFYDSNRVKNFIDLLKNKFNQQQPSNQYFSEEIHTRPAPCAQANRALAVHCDESNSADMRGRFILYDKKYLENLTEASPNSDWFVLAHEMGHHICNHLHDKDYRSTEHIGLRNAEMDKMAIYNDVISQNHIKELEADNMSVWFLKSINVQSANILYWIELIADKEGVNLMSKTETHPSWYTRKMNVKRLLDNWENDFKKRPEHSTIAKARGFATESYDQILQSESEEAKARMTAMEREQSIKRNSLRNARLMDTDGDKSEKDELYLSARSKYEDALDLFGQAGDMTDSVQTNNIKAKIAKINSILNRKNFNRIEPTFSLQYPFIHLKDQEKRYPVNTGLTWAAGIRFAHYSWVKRHRYEADLTYNTAHFNVYTTTSGQRKAVESFKLNFLSFQPRYTYSTIGTQELIEKSKKGVIFTLGPAVNFPLQSKYQNLEQKTGEERLIMKTAVGGTAGIGIESMRRKTTGNFGNFRAILMAAYTPFVFQNTNQREGSQASGLFVGLNLSFRRW